MKRVISEVKPKTVEEFQIQVSEVWEQIPIDTTIKNLVNSFTQRCFLCLQNEGKCINHLIHRNMPVPTDDQIEELFEQCQQKGIVLNEIPLYVPKSRINIKIIFPGKWEVKLNAKLRLFFVNRGSIVQKRLKSTYRASLSDLYFFELKMIHKALKVC